MKRILVCFVLYYYFFNVVSLATVSAEQLESYVAAVQYYPSAWIDAEINGVYPDNNGYDAYGTSWLGRVRGNHANGAEQIASLPTDAQDSSNRKIAESTTDTVNPIRGWAAAYSYAKFGTLGAHAAASLPNADSLESDPHASSAEARAMFEDQFYIDTANTSSSLAYMKLSYSLHGSTSSFGAGAFSGEALMDWMVSGGCLMSHGGTQYNSNPIDTSLMVPILLDNGMNLRMSLWVHAFVTDEQTGANMNREGGFSSTDLSHTLHITSLQFYYDAEGNDLLDPTTYTLHTASGYTYRYTPPTDDTTPAETQPVPEPATLLLLSTGMFAIRFIKKK